jgi:hypothetical protein
VSVSEGERDARALPPRADDPVRACSYAKSFVHTHYQDEPELMPLLVAASVRARAVTALRDALDLRAPRRVVARAVVRVEVRACVYVRASLWCDDTRSN